MNRFRFRYYEKIDHRWVEVEFVSTDDNSRFYHTIEGCINYFAKNFKGHGLNTFSNYLGKDRSYFWMGLRLK